MSAKRTSHASTEPDLVAETALSRYEIDDVLQALDRAAVATAERLSRFYRSAICKTKPEPDLIDPDGHAKSQFGQWFEKRRDGASQRDAHGDGSVLDQPAFEILVGTHRALYAHTAILAKRAWTSDRVPVEEYDALLEKINQFNDKCRLLSRAFQAALSQIDPLTGIHTRQTMERDLSRERQRARRTAQPCTIALADIDHFKRVNDQYGHAIGDRVLAAITQLFVEALRPYDTVYRYGGEEFLISLPDTGTEEAVQVLDRLRERIANKAISLGEEETLHVTVSFGVAALTARRQVRESIKLADQALYKAKSDGRNRIRIGTT